MDAQAIEEINQHMMKEMEWNGMERNRMNKGQERATTCIRSKAHTHKLRENKYKYKISIYLSPLLAMTLSSISRIMLRGNRAAPLKGGPSKNLDPVTRTTKPLWG